MFGRSNRPKNVITVNGRRMDQEQYDEWKADQELERIERELEAKREQEARQVLDAWLVDDFDANRAKNDPATGLVALPAEYHWHLGYPYQQYCDEYEVARVLSIRHKIYGHMCRYNVMAEDWPEVTKANLSAISREALIAIQEASIADRNRAPIGAYPPNRV